MDEMQRFRHLFISINFSKCFRRFLRPSSGAQNCTYSVRYCQNNTVAIVDEMEFHLMFVVPCIFNHSNKTNQPDATTNHKILLPCRTDTAQNVSGITMSIIRSPSNCRCSLWCPIMIKDSVVVKKKIKKQRSIVYKIYCFVN
jgi:hypothetical protein